MRNVSNTEIKMSIAIFMVDICVSFSESGSNLIAHGAPGLENIMKQHSDFQACQGDLRIRQLSDADAARLNTATIIRPAARGSIRLLEGEVTGHHHEIVMDRPADAPKIKQTPKP